MAETDNFNVEQWKEQKEAEKNFAFNTIEQTALSLNDTDKLKAYLDVQARFDKYSVGNALLVMAQKPDAKKLGDSKTWKEKNVYIKKGEKGIIVLQPGKEYTQKDGTVKSSFETKKVFDISQTTSIIPAEEKNNTDIKVLIKGIMNTSKIPIMIDDNINGAEYSADAGCIRIRNGYDGEEVFRMLSEEIAASLTENNRVEAYCVSYLICTRNGIAPKECTLTTPFKDMNSKQIKSLLEDVRNTASRFDYFIGQELKKETRNHDIAR